jgi:PEP-CTERM motif
MKKIILTITAVVAASLSGFSQGQVYFENVAANGFVATDPNGHTTGSTSGYVQQAASFDVACYSLDVTTTSGLNGLDSYGYLDPLDLTSDGFTQDTVAGSLTPLVGTDGAFGTGSSYPTAIIPGVTSANAVIAVVVWTGGYSSYAAALASGTSVIGILVFVQAIGGAAPSPSITDIATGWGTVPNSPTSAANGGNEDLILSPVPEPGTMALAGLGSLSLFLLRRKK